MPLLLFLLVWLIINYCRRLPDEKSLRNIKENNRVSIVTKYNGEYYRINGKAKIYSKGKYLDTAIKRSEPPLPKHAIVIKIKEIFDLDKLKQIL